MQAINIIQCSNLGGMEHAAARLTTALARRGYRWQTLSLSKAGLGAPLFAGSRRTFDSLDYAAMPWWQTAVKVHSCLQRLTPDAILYTGHNLYAALPLILPRRRPAVLWQHFHHTGVKSRFSWRFIYEQAIRCFDRIVFASQFIRDEALSIAPAIELNSEVIYNPLPPVAVVTPQERHQAQGLFGARPGDLVVGNAGWLIRRKRFDVFLRVVSHLYHQARVPVFAIIAGDGPEAGQLRRLAEDLKITSRVSFLGFQVNLRSFYAALDALLFNSDWDAFPTTPLEAMNHAVPTVVSCVHSGLGEIFPDSLRARFLHSAHNIEALSEAIQCVSRDSTLGTLQQQIVQTRLAQEPLVNRFDQLLSNVRA